MRAGSGEWGVGVSVVKKRFQKPARMHITVMWEYIKLAVRCILYSTVDIFLIPCNRLISQSPETEPNKEEGVTIERSVTRLTGCPARL